MNNALQERKYWFGVKLCEMLLCRLQIYKAYLLSRGL